MVDPNEVVGLAGAAALRVCGVLTDESEVEVSEQKDGGLRILVDRMVGAIDPPTETAQETVEVGEGHSCTMQGEVCDVEE